jgi:para-nitrobenzyl esterase
MFGVHRVAGGFSWRSLVLALAGSVVIAACSSSNNDTSDPSIVSTTDGKVMGTVADNYRSFLGIPYAAPPVGDLRWKAPQPPASWSGTRDATKFGKRCAQFATPLENAFSADEDCLYLNVYTPYPLHAPRPVMVWLHGGTFTIGAGSDYEGSTLSSMGDVVLVTVNYRIGPFGFLALKGLEAEDPNGSTGNYGLMDQIAALQWVQANIGKFGGDANNVTIFGESAGGMSVCSHMASPLSSGTFHKAIVESGPCSAVLIAKKSQAESFGKSFAARAGLDCAGTASAIVSCMRSKSTVDIMNAETVTEGHAESDDFVPVVDGYILPQTPGDAIKAGAFSHVPMIQGTNHDEGKLFVALMFDLAVPPQPLDNSNYPVALEQLLSSLSPTFALFGSVVTPLIVQKYPTGNYPAPAGFDQDLTPAHVAASTVMTDSGFACPAVSTDADLVAAGVPVYAYEFSDPHPPIPAPIAADPYLPPPLTGHAAELVYVFQAPLDDGAVSPSMFTADQLALSTQMLKYWTNFATTGNPNGDGLSNWPLYSGSNGELLTFAPGANGVVAGDTKAFKSDHHCGFWGLLGI